MRVAGGGAGVALEIGVRVDRVGRVGRVGRGRPSDSPMKVRNTSGLG